VALQGLSSRVCTVSHIFRLSVNHILWIFYRFVWLIWYRHVLAKRCRSCKNTSNAHHLESAVIDDALKRGICQNARIQSLVRSVTGQDPFPHGDASLPLKHELLAGELVEVGARAPGWEVAVSWPRGVD
jgi:hypothetical protein